MLDFLGNIGFSNTSPKTLGRWGENRACAFLRRRGHKILAKNFTCKTGEIDVIAVDSDSSIVFVEVKTRSDESFASAESAITGVKKQRLIRAARNFIAKNNITDRPFRFDIITIVTNKSRIWLLSKPKISHYKNAFTP